MIEDIGKVVRVEGDNAFVAVERTSACAQCGLQAAEELTDGKPILAVILAYVSTQGDMWYTADRSSLSMQSDIARVLVHRPQINDTITYAI